LISALAGVAEKAPQFSGPARAHGKHAMVSAKSILKLKATTLRGLEDVLVQELQTLGAKNVDKQHGAVLFSGDFELMYRCCYRLRTAVRVLLQLASTRIADQKDLYDLGRSVSWNELFAVNKTIAVDSAVHSRIFSNSHYAALKLKDAVCDEFRSKTGKRPDVSLKEADIRIHLHIHEQDCTISLDAAGGSLHRRGYRVRADIAPLSEVLAAGMVLLAEPDPEKPFYDFMCGSGTLPIEAFMIRYDLPCGVFREVHAFENWRNYFEKTHRTVRQQEKGRWTEFLKKSFSQSGSDIPDNPPAPLTDATGTGNEQSEATDQPVTEEKIVVADSQEGRLSAPGQSPLFRGSDRSWKAMEIAKSNRKAMGLTSSHILFETRDAFSDAFSIAEPGAGGTAIINPPYGERMSLEDAAAFYKELGDTMKRSFKGWSVWVLSSNKEAMKRIGLKPSKKLTLYNGPLECTYRRYDMY